MSELTKPRTGLIIYDDDLDGRVATGLLLAAFSHNCHFGLLPVTRLDFANGFEDVVKIVKPKLYDRIFIVDISIQAIRPALEIISKSSIVKVLFIDHHDVPHYKDDRIKLKKELENEFSNVDFLVGRRLIKNSAAFLVWDLLERNNESMPEEVDLLVDYVSQYDSFSFDSREAEAFCFGAAALELTPNWYAKGMATKTADFARVVTSGQAIQAVAQAIAKQVDKSAKESAIFKTETGIEEDVGVTINLFGEGYMSVSKFINGNPANQSPDNIDGDGVEDDFVAVLEVSLPFKLDYLTNYISRYLLMRHLRVDFIRICHQVGNKKVFSLRARNMSTIDLSLFARRMGGGGHPTAAGYSES